MEEKIKLLALPCKSSSTSATISVCIDLSFAGTATDLQVRATKFREWPTVIKTGKFIVSIEGAQIQVLPDFRQLDTVLWSNLFDDLKIKPEAVSQVQTLAPLETPAYSSYSLSQAQKSILRFHEQILARSGSAGADLTAKRDHAVRFAFNSSPEFTDYPDLEWFFDERRNAQDKLVLDLLDARKRPLSSPRRPTGDQNDKENFQDLLLFHTRTDREREEILKSLRELNEERLANPQSFDPPEFHERIRYLGQFPKLMRSLGLIFDLQMPASNLPPGKFDLSVDVEGLGIIPEKCVTKAYASTDRKEFFVVSRHAVTSTSPRDLAKSEDFSHGKLNLGENGKFPVVQIDAAGSILKLTHFAENMTRMRQSPAAGGTSVDPLLAEVPLSAAPPSIRTIGLSLTRSRQAQVVAEARRAQKTALAAVAGGVNEVYAEDIIRGYAIDVSFREKNTQWSGWHSLCLRDTRLDIKGILKTDYPDEGWISPLVSSKEPGVSRVFVNESLTTWDGWSLVAPRPINPTADCKDSPVTEPRPLDGVFVPIITARAGSLPKLRYGSSYRLQARMIDLAGNDMSISAGGKDDPVTTSDEILYSRFEPVNSPVFNFAKELGDDSPGETLDHMVLRSFSKTSAPRRRQSTQRNIFPPKTSIDMAIQHGELDSFTSPDQSYNMVEKQDGELLDVYPDKQVSVPYLPDPLAIGVRFETAYGSEQMLFLGKWPYRKSMRINLIAGRIFKMVLEEAAGVVTIHLPPSEMTVVKVKSLIPEENIQKLAHWQQMQKAAPHLTGSAAAGASHWMLAPFRPLYLIHAVQQPIEAPIFVIEKDKPGTINFGPKDRKLGETFADLKGSIQVHNKSTGKIELTGSWHDAEDDPRKPGPETSELRQSQVFERSVNYDDTGPVNFGSSPGEPTRQIFNDTKYREVTYNAIGTTRFVEHLFTPKEREDGKHLDFILTKETSEQEKLLLSRKILSTARPSPCSGVYALPLFGWKERAVGETNEGRKFVSRQRIGGGLRIYMDRGWYSSGAGEMLGVVLCAEAVRETPAELQSLTSAIGSDPLWKAKGVDFRLKPAHFLNREHVLEGVDIDGSTYTLSEVNIAEKDPYPDPLRVQVAAFTPQYNSQRRLWYCDIEVDAGDLYFPFIRLALARYQPNSVRQELGRDCHLSKVVQADFIQLAPNRMATITFDPDDKRSITITVSGAAPRASAAFSEPNKIEVTVEKRDKTRESGWVPESSVILTASGDDAVTTWTKNARISKKDRDKFRVVIREYEKFKSDSSDSVDRLVYADVIELED